MSSAVALGGAKRAPDSWNIRVLERAGEAILFLGLIPILLVPAFWNGFPIMYYDTGAYVAEGLGGEFILERSPVYSLFLRFAGAGESLWLIAFIQATLVSFLITETTRAVAPRLRAAVALLIGAVLMIGTGLSWYVGQVEPDCFTAIVVLAIYLLAFHRPMLGRVRTTLLICVGALAVGVHPSHLLLATFLLSLMAALRLLIRGRLKPQLLQPAILCSAGLVLVVAANFGYTGAVFVSRAGPSFVFARMLQDGIVMRVLEDTCPKSGYRLCAYRDSLPASADAWLWTPRSPFVALGRFPGTADESARIVRDAILRYPRLQLEAAARNAFEQFVHFGTGDQIEPQEWVLTPVLTRYMPAQLNSYLAARQQRGQIKFHTISNLDIAVGTLSLLAIAALLGLLLRTRRFELALFQGFVLAALIGNAAICGILSGPHDRYQSRLIWLAPFAVLITTSLLRSPCGADANPAVRTM